MKIITASVTDPRRGGEYRNPYLSLDVDEKIHETGVPEFLNGSRWQLTPHGPFVAIDWVQDKDSVMDGDLGVFNTTGLHKSRLVEVEVNEPGSAIDLAMPLDRARRLLRRHNLPWRYVLDDVAGQHGKLLWRLVETRPSCVECGGPANHEAYYRGTHLSFCDAHMSEHNRKVRHLRVNS